MGHLARMHTLIFLSIPLNWGIDVAVLQTLKYKTYSTITAIIL